MTHRDKLRAAALVKIASKLNKPDEELGKHAREVIKEVEAEVAAFRASERAKHAEREAGGGGLADMGIPPKEI